MTKQNTNVTTILIVAAALAIGFLSEMQPTPHSLVHQPHGSAAQAYGLANQLHNPTTQSSPMGTRRML